MGLFDVLGWIVKNIVAVFGWAFMLISIYLAYSLYLTITRC